MKTTTLIAVIVVIVAIIVAGVAVYYYLTLPPPPPKKEILIGTSVSLTGKFSFFGQEHLRAYQIWVEKVNSEGGIYLSKYKTRLPVRLIYYDDASDASTAAKLYEKLITEDHVDFVLSPFSSTITFSVSTITEKYHYPLVTTYAASPGIYSRGFKYIFSVQPIAENDTKPFLEMLSKLPNRPSTVAIVASKTEWTMHAGKGALHWAEKYGFKVVLYEEFEPNPSDFSPLILKLKSINPDVVIAATYVSETLLFYRQMKELDFKPKAIWFGNGPDTPVFIETFGKDADGVFCFWTNKPWSTPDPEIQWLRETYKKKYGREPSNFVALPYASCQILQQAIEQAGDIDREAVRDILAKGTFKAINGMNKFDPTGQNILAYVGVLQIINGTNQWVYPEGPEKTADPIYPYPYFSG